VHSLASQVELMSVRVAFGAWFVLVFAFSVSVGVCSSVAFYASAVFCVGLCCWVSSLHVPFGFLLAFLSLPPFPLSRLFLAHFLQKSKALSSALMWLFHLTSSKPIS
jgi:hypothetical protein